METYISLTKLAAPFRASVSTPAFLCGTIATLLAAATTATALSPGDTATGNGALASETLDTSNPDNETVGDFNTADGFDALNGNRHGSYNTAVGAFSLAPNDGSYNTAIGAFALRSNDLGIGNVAVGAFALTNNHVRRIAGGIFGGHNNTATGFYALSQNIYGQSNTATGSYALYSNTTGDENTANGSGALYSNTTGLRNTATGSFALNQNTSGVNNTASGYQALYRNTTGYANTATGEFALFSAKGSQNTALGQSSLLSVSDGTANTACGTESLRDVIAGYSNIALGYRAGILLASGNYNIYIGAPAGGNENNTLRIGNAVQQAFIGGIYGKPSPAGAAVYVTADGKLGTSTSSRRFKENIRSMDAASEAILALKPVTFRYKEDIDPAGTPQYGLVAEDVEKVDPTLVLHDAEGQTYTVRYEAVNAMVLNEFLKQHREVQEQKKTVAAQQSEIKALNERLQALDSRMQKFVGRRK